MNTPADGAILAGASETFTWSANGAAVSNWIFQLGTTLGGSNLHYSGVKPASTVSANVVNLPTNASTIYARLRYLANGTWTSIDQTYTAADLTPSIVDPSPGTTLDASNVTFTWTDGGAAVNAWIFQIGTTLGGSNLYYSGTLAGATSSATVVGLPTDSRVLYVRLRYLVGSSWLNIDTTYTAADLLPSMVSPTSGSTIGGASATFEWNSNGAPVTYWIFQIGTDVGLSNIHYGGVVTPNVLSKTVTGLPVNGATLHVRLRYLANGAWKHVDTTYTAASTP